MTLFMVTSRFGWPCSCNNCANPARKTDPLRNTKESQRKPECEIARGAGWALYESYRSSTSHSRSYLAGFSTPLGRYSYEARSWTYAIICACVLEAVDLKLQGLLRRVLTCLRLICISFRKENYVVVSWSSEIWSTGRICSKWTFANQAARIQDAGKTHRTQIQLSRIMQAYLGQRGTRRRFAGVFSSRKSWICVYRNSA